MTTALISIDNVFEQVAVLLALTAVAGFVATRLRQPLIIAYLAIGILAGPDLLGIVDPEQEQIELLAELGIALLLFVVGLRLDLKLIRTTGPVALATGVGQIVFTSVFGFLIALALGLDVVPAIYVAIALTFSSTIIIVKLLSDKREIDDLHGRIAVGFLIVQDIAVVFAMSALNAFGAAEGEQSAALEISAVFGKGILFVIAIAALMRWAIPPLLHRLARSPELLVLFAIAWAVTLAAVGDGLGFSREVGAFLGGVSLASTPYRDAIGARLVGLRDFLLLFFFIVLGSRLDLALLGDQVAMSIVFSLFVLIGNPLIVVVIMGRMGYRARTGFLAGLTVAQISEFSLILAALGLSLGHIGDETVALITTVGLVTIAVSTYMILNSHWLFERLGPRLSVFERPAEAMRDEDAETPGAEVEPDVIVCGLGRYGTNIGERIHREGREVLGVDFDPLALGRWRESGRPAIYGDAEDPELPSYLPRRRARWVISSVPRVATNKVLIQSLRHHGYSCKVAVTANNDEDQRELAEAGADLILRPFSDAADHVEDLLEKHGLPPGHRA